MSISLHNVYYDFKHHNVLQNISGTFATGSFTAIFGANGSGKSTLMRLIAQDLPLPIAQGRIVRTQSIAYLPQQSSLRRDFPIKVCDVALGGCIPRMRFWGNGRAYQNSVQLALEAVGLHNCYDCAVQQLSSGQLQRLLFARLMLQDASTILLDEPFNAVDEKTVKDLSAILQQWHQQGKTIVVVLHDTAQIKALCRQTMVLSGKVVAWGDTLQVFANDAVWRSVSSPHVHHV